MASLVHLDGLAAQIFRTETRVVVLHATVTNSRGELVTNLDRNAFTVREDGKPQPLSLFGRDDVPVSLGILIDNSGSMRRKRQHVEAAALAFVRASNPQDEVFVMNFAGEPRLDVPFTSDIGRLERGIARVDALGGTALRDAVDAAADYLNEHAIQDRKALLVITDGNDNASVTPVRPVRQKVERREIVMFAIGLLGEDDAAHTARARHELEEFTDATGGVAVFPARLEDIQESVLEIAHQIRTQYTIAYAPLNPALDGSYRRIQVTVTGRERLSVRTRTGYRAVPGP